uniref:FERM domain-containing protein n=1 Tax=Caenorhabditis japonica TaxID=281687 RepID=A0A8R1DJV7_CAEJA
MSPKDVRCNIHLLHDSDIIGNEFPRTQSAQTVLDYVCELKRIQEKDFLGLRYQDHNKHRYWLDLSRSIGHVVKHFRKEIKRVGKTDTMTLHLRFRYYPSDPARLSDPNLRYQLFVQLQRDLLHGRLYCPATSAAELAALILQAQLGDYDETKHVGNYVSEYKLLLKQTPKLEERIASIHKELHSSHSVPTVSSSTTASVVQRYELPRQTPRTEQPWLSKPKNNHVNSFSDNATSTFSTASTPIDESYNNNLRKITNLNISLDNSSTPSSSSPVDIQEPPKIIRTFEHAEQNSTSFTVHLIKREEIVTPTTPTTSSCHQETRAEHLEHKFNKLVENDVDIGRPLASSTPRANKQTPNLEKIENGTVGNGQGVVEKKTSNGHAIQRTEEVQDSLISDKSEISPKTSFVSKAANTLFVLFLMLLLTLALIIVLFEKSEGSHRDFIESNRHLSDLRHHYYEPSRHYVVAQYHKYFGAKL